MALDNILNKKAIAYHGIEGAKYVMRGTTDTPASPKPVLYSKAIAYNIVLNKQDIYADNVVLGSIPSDKGYEGTFGMTAQDREFEKDLGILMELDNGLAVPTLTVYKRIDLYYEYKELLDSGEEYTVKVWLLNVEIGKATATNHATDADNITIGEYQLPIKIMGDYIMSGDGEDDFYRDELGNRRKALYIRSVPGYDGYEDFEKQSPKPKTSKASGG